MTNVFHCLRRMSFLAISQENDTTNVANYTNDTYGTCLRSKINFDYIL